MTRNTKMKTTQDQAANMENEGQGQQQAPPTGKGQGVTVAPAGAAADAATDQDIDTASVGLEPPAERPARRSRRPRRRRPMARGTDRRPEQDGDPRVACSWRETDASCPP
jgi:hypothetical protein